MDATLKKAWNKDCFQNDSHNILSISILENFNLWNSNKQPEPKTLSFTFEQTALAILLYYDLVIHLLCPFPQTHFLILMN